MKTTTLRLCVIAVAALISGSVLAAPTEEQLKASAEAYFTDLFGRLGKAAAKAPTEATFRDVMRPQIEAIDGLFGATLINADWEIRQVYFKRDFLAVGFSLTRVKELDLFRALMSKAPGPQLSEPGHGSIMQPRLIALRYPIMKSGQADGMVSMMIRTEAFLKAVGLDSCKAFTFTCLGKKAESKGTLTAAKKTVRLALPSTEWVIEYE